MALLDSEIRDALVDLVSTIYANKRISKKKQMLCCFMDFIIINGSIMQV